MTQAHQLACMHAIFLHTHAQISAKLGQIREIMVSIQEIRLVNLVHQNNPRTKASMHACYVLMYTGPYLSQIWKDCKDEAKDFSKAPPATKVPSAGAKEELLGIPIF